MGFKEKMGVSFFDRERFTSPASGARGGAVERGAASQIVEENEEGAENLWGLGDFQFAQSPSLL